MFFEIVRLVAWYQYKWLVLLSCNQCGDLAEVQVCFKGLNLFFIIIILLFLLPMQSESKLCLSFPTSLSLHSSMVSTQGKIMSSPVCP